MEMSQAGGKYSIFLGQLLLRNHNPLERCWAFRGDRPAVAEE